MRVGLRTGLWGREDLTRRFLSHYNGMAETLEDEGIELTLVAVESQGPAYLDRVSPDPCLWHFIWHPNLPWKLGEKMRQGLFLLREFAPACVLNLGSDDFVGINTVRQLAEMARRGVDFTGYHEFYYAHAQHGMKLWPGYPAGTPREGEPIGAGRFYSSDLLDALGWNLWVEGGTGSMDGHSWARVKARQGRYTIQLVGTDDVGPMVDVKNDESITTWDRLGPYNRPVPLDRARGILSSVGLKGMLG